MVTILKVTFTIGRLVGHVSGQASGAGERRTVSANGNNPMTGEPATASGRWLLAALAVVTALAVSAAVLFRASPAPAPEDIAKDKFLSKGHALYQMRCVSCHGTLGKGDGPIAKSIVTAPPGDFTDGVWKHGDKPDQMLKVITEGVSGTQMSGWASVFTPSELKAVAGYVYHLAKLPVPAEYRVGWEPGPNDQEDDENP